MILVPKEGTPKDSQLGSAIMDPFATQSGSVTSICISCIEAAKHNYFMKIGQTLSNDDTGQKAYWSLINKVLNKAKTPEI